MADGPAANLLASLRRVMSTLIAMVETRLELLVVEFEEERVRLGEMLVLGALAFLCLMLSIILIAFLIIVLFWETHRIESMLGVIVFFLLAAFALGRAVVAKKRERPRLFAATLGELRRDREELRGDTKEKT